MLIACVLVLALALATTAAATPIVRSIALYRDLIDRPNHRKVHTDGVPRLGGLALGASIFAAIGLVVLLVPEARGLVATRVARLASLLVGCSILGLVGFLDDLRGLGARPKLVAQILAGLVAFAGGNQFRFFEGAIVGSTVGLALNLIATVVWVVAITNAMNLIDGGGPVLPVQRAAARHQPRHRAAGAARAGSVHGGRESHPSPAPAARIRAPALGPDALGHHAPVRDGGA